MMGRGSTNDKTLEIGTVNTQLMSKSHENHDRALEYLDILQSLATMSLSHMETDEGLREFMEQSVGLLGGDTGGIWLVNDETGEVTPRVIVGSEVGDVFWSAVDPKAILSEEVLGEGKPLVVDSIDRLRSVAEEQDGDKDTSGDGIGLLLAMPLQARGNLCGFVGVAWQGSRTFSSEDMTLGEIVADRVSTSIEFQVLNDKLHVSDEDLQSCTDERADVVKYLEALEAISEVGLSQMETDEMLGELIKRFVDKLGSDLGAIWLLDEDLGTLVPKASFSSGAVDFSEFVVDVGRAWDGVITSSQCLVVEDTSQCAAVEDIGGSTELREMLEKTMPDRGLGAMLAMPLSVQDKFFGVVAVFWTQPRQFDARLKKLLEVTADRAATAIEARRLSEGLRLLNEGLQRSNEELRQTTEELTKANRAKSDFFNTMSHDLRSPLDAIAGYTSLMLRERYGSVTPKQTHALHRIEENAKHLLLIVNAILDLARIEAGRMPVHYEQVELEVLIYETAAAVEPLITGPGVGLEVSIGNDMPVIWTDRGKLKQILVNLLDNAAKFTQEGTIEISARRVSENGCVEIAVKDTGVGIREEEIDSIFEAYTQADSITTRDRVGTGLGLSICKKFAALLGGDIGVQSVYGQGSTFTVTIPCAPPANTPPDPDAFSQSGGVGGSP